MLLFAVALTVGTLAMAQISFAQIYIGGAGWNSQLTRHIAVEATYSDNINLQSENEQDSWVFTALAGLGLVANANRLQGSAFYQVGYSYYENLEKAELTHSGSVGLSSMLIRDLLFVNASGYIAETFTSDDRYSLNPLANPDSGRTVYGGSISPSLQFNLTPYAGAAVGYTLTGQSDDDNTTNDYYSQVVSANISSSPLFSQRLQLDLLGEYGQYTTVYADDNLADTHGYAGSVSAGANLALSPHISVFGRVGLDDIDTFDTLRDSALSDLWWRTGVDYHPSPRFNIGAYIGRRYDDFDYGGNLNLLVSNRVGLSASLSRTIDVSRRFSDLAFYSGRTSDGVTVYRTDDWTQDSSFSADDLTTNVYEAFALDRNTGRTGRLSDPNFGRISEIALIDNGQLRLAIDADTTQLGIGGTVQRRQYGTNQDDFEWVYGLSLSALTQWTPSLTSSTNVYYTKTKSDYSPENDATSFGGALNFDLQVNPRLVIGSGFLFNHYQSDYNSTLYHDTYGLEVGADYTIAPGIAAYSKYTHSWREAPAASSEYRENAITLGVRASF